MSERSNHGRQIVGWGIVGLIAVIAVSIALSIYLAPGGRGGYFPFHFGWLGGIFVILLVFWIARWFFWPWRRGGWYRYEHRSAESILKERYAMGEITKERFEEMIRDLRNNA